MTSTDSTSPIDTFGWDMVVGVPLPAANAALQASAQSLPASFSYAGTSGEQSFTMTGRFGPWSIAGGSGQDLLLDLPIASGTMTVPAGPPGLLTPGTYDLSGAVVPIATRLSFTQPAASGGSRSLVFAFQAGDQPATGTGTPSSSGEALNTATLDPVAAALLPNAVAACLAQDSGSMSFVFADLVPRMTGTGSGGGQLQYMIGGQAGQPGFLVIFYAAAAGASLPAQIPTAVTVDGAQGTVALSQQSVLSSVLLPAIVRGLSQAQFPFPPSYGLMPALPRSVGNAQMVDPSNFATAVTGSTTGTITAANPFPLNFLGYQNGVPATLSGFTGMVDGSQLSLSYTAAVTDGVEIALSVSQSFTVQVASPGADRPGVSLVADGQPSVQLGPGTNALVWLIPQSVVEDCVGNRVTGGIAQGLTVVEFPLSVTLFGNQQIQPATGQLNGGLSFTGPIQPGSPGDGT